MAIFVSPPPPKKKIKLILNTENAKLMLKHCLSLNSLFGDGGGKHRVKTKLTVETLYNHST